MPTNPRQRIAWKIGDKEGHGEWFDSPARFEETVKDLNKVYGQGTHWIEEEKEDEN